MNLAPEERLVLERALIFDDLRVGKGSNRQKAAFHELEWRKCAESVVYWAKKYAYIVVGGRVVKWHDPDNGYEIWPIQLSLLETLQDLSDEARNYHISGGIVGVKSRQLGITTTVGHFNYWDCMFHDATAWDLFSHSEDKAKDIIKRVQPTHNRLPAWMKERAQVRETRDKDRVRQAHRSQSVTRYTFGLSEMKIQTSTAKNIQGATSNVDIDEATNHDDLDEKLDQMMATTDGAHGIGVVIANGRGQDPFHDFYYAAKKGENGYRHYFFWWGTAPYRLVGATWVDDEGVEHPVEELFDENDPTREAVRRVAEKGRLSAPWYDQMEAKYIRGGNPDLRRQIFQSIYPTTEEHAFFVTGNSRFDLKLINDMIQEIEKADTKPSHGIIEAGAGRYVFRPLTTGHVRLYRKPTPLGRYVIGADPSGGGRAGDFGVMQVFKMESEGIEQVAVYQAKVEPALFAYELDKLGRYYNDALIVIEANNHGNTVIDNIKEGYVNLYMRKKWKARFLTQDGSDIGWWADPNTKPKVIDQLAMWLEEGMVELHDIETLKELARYQQDPLDSKKTSAPRGANDDLVMGLALAVEGAVDLDNSYIDGEAQYFQPWE